MPSTPPSVAHALQAIRRCEARSEQIDHAILSAINVTLVAAVFWAIVAGVFLLRRREDPTGRIERTARAIWRMQLQIWLFA